MKTSLLCIKYIKGGGCFYHFSIICSTFVAGFRISAIPKDIVGKRNGVRYLICQRMDKVSVHVIAWTKLI